MDENDPRYGLSLQVILEMSEDWLAAAALFDEAGVPVEKPDGTPMTWMDRLLVWKEQR